MRSVNSARAAGAQIGKSLPDLGISQHDLLAVVDARILPRIKLHRSPQDVNAEQTGRAFATLLILAAGALYVCVDIVLPGLMLPDEAGRWLVVAVLGASLLAVLTALCGLAWRKTEAAAQHQRRRTIYALREAAFVGALEAINRRRAAAGVPLRENLQRGTAAPASRSGVVTPREAEEIAAQWMRHLGERAAAVTPFRGDGGVDVSGTRYLAQVKHLSANVGVAPIREIAGAAMIDGRAALFFTSTGYSAGAIDFANRSRVALFVYRTSPSELRAINSLALELMSRGLA